MHEVNNGLDDHEPPRPSRSLHEDEPELEEFDPHGGHNSGAVQESLVQRHTVNGKHDSNNPSYPRSSLGEGGKQNGSGGVFAESKNGTQVTSQTKITSEAKKDSQNVVGGKESTKKSFQNAPSQPQKSSPEAPVADQPAPTDPKKAKQGEPKAPKDGKSGQAKPHWETLYDLSKIKTETREIILKEKERQEERHLKECTFTPNIIGEAKLLQERNPMDTYKRNQEWKQKREEKRQHLVETQHQREDYLCTFKPVLTKNTETLSRTKDYNISHQLGIEKYLERQQLARAEKDRVERVMNGVNQVKGRADGKGGYAAKFHRIKQKEDEDVVLALRQTNFAQGALILHNYLNMMDIKF